MLTMYRRAPPLLLILSSVLGISGVVLAQDPPADPCLVAPKPWLDVKLRSATLGAPRDGLLFEATFSQRVGGPAVVSALSAEVRDGAGVSYSIALASAGQEPLRDNALLVALRPKEAWPAQTSFEVHVTSHDMRAPGCSSEPNIERIFHVTTGVSLTEEPPFEMPALVYTDAWVEVPESCCAVHETPACEDCEACWSHVREPVLALTWPARPEEADPHGSTLLLGAHDVLVPSAGLPFGPWGPPAQVLRNSTTPGLAEEALSGQVCVSVIRQNRRTGLSHAYSRCTPVQSDAAALAAISLPEGVSASAPEDPALLFGKVECTSAPSPMADGAGLTVAAAYASHVEAIGDAAIGVGPSNDGQRPTALATRERGCQLVWGRTRGDWSVVILAALALFCARRAGARTGHRVRSTF